MADIKEETVEEQPIGIRMTFIEALVTTNETLSLWRQLLAFCGITLLSFVSVITKMVWSLFHQDFLPLFGILQQDPAGDLFHIRLALGLKMLGTMVAGFSMYFIGRRINVIMASILYLIMVVILISKSKLKVMVIGYLLSEFAWAYMMVIFYVYLAEISEPRFRASFMGANELLFFLPALMTSNFMESNIMFLLLFCLMLSCLSVILSASAPESPYWLALTGRREMAENVFYHLHANSVDLTEVVITCDEAEQDAIWKAAGMHGIVFSLKFMIPLLIMLFMIFSYGILVPFGRASLFDLYETIHLQHNDLWEFWTEYLISFISNYCALIGSAAFILLALKIPRRILFISSVSLGLLLLVPHLIASVVRARFLLATCIYTYPLFYLFAYFGGSQLLRIIPVEIFPGPGRDLGSTIYFLLEFILEAFAHNAFDLEFINMDSTRFRWFMFPFGFVFTFLFMPETKDLSLVNAHNIGSDLKQIKLFFTSTDLKIEEEEIIN